MVAFRHGAAVLVLVSAQAVASPAVPAQAEPIGCGTVLTESVVLTADVVGCPGDTLVVGADNITVDLGGHFVGSYDQFSPDVGVRIQGHDGITLVNGFVSGGAYAVLLSRGANGNTLRRLAVTGGIASIAVMGSNRNTIINNHSYAAVGYGILLAHADGNILKRNRMAKPNDDGNGHDGIALLDDSDRNRVVENVTSNDIDGVHVAAHSDHNLIAWNNASLNFDDGIEVDDPHNTVRGNTANRNERGYGIRAVPGTRDGGGNTASGNGYGAEVSTGVQCLNIACS